MFITTEVFLHYRRSAVIRKIGAEFAVNIHYGCFVGKRLQFCVSHTDELKEFDSAVGCVDSVDGCVRDGNKAGDV